MKAISLAVAVLGYAGVACSGGVTVRDAPNAEGGERAEVGEGAMAPGLGETVVGKTPTKVWDHPWNVVVHTRDEVTGTAGRSDGLKFTLAFPTSNGEPYTIASEDGVVVSLRLERQPDGSMLQVPGETSVFGTPEDSITLTLSDLTLKVVNGDLTGTASGIATYTMHDDLVYSPHDVDVSISGTPDSIAPTLVPPINALKPTDRLRVTASEALASGTVSLTGIGETVLLSGPGSDLLGPNGLIELTTEQVLPLSQTWQLSGTGSDFAGNLLQLGQSVATVADPGVFEQDGFEGAVHATLEGSTSTIIDSSFAIKPIAGNHSLLVQAGSTAMLHLQRAPAQTTLALTVIALIPSGVVASTLVQQVGVAAVVGGTQRVQLSWLATRNDAIGTTLPPMAPAPAVTWPTVSNPALLKVTLSDAGSDVVLAISAPLSSTGPYGANGPRYAASSLLIDDVHLE